MKRVVVTGMGVVSPVGIGVPAFWRALCEGVCGIRPITRFDASAFDVRQAGQVECFDPPADVAGGEMDLGTQMAIAAAAEALGEAEIERQETGIVLATNFGGIRSAEACLGVKGQCQPGTAGRLLEYSFERAVERVADRWGFGGPRVALSLSCASGTAAVGFGTDLIRQSRARRILAGGYDALSVFSWSGLSALRTMTKEKIRPFDRTRAGTIFGEGAGILLLEERDCARARGATILAEVCGHAMNNNAFHMTAPDKGGEGLRLAMEAALADSGLSAADIDHVNAHGTGTRYNDLAETQAVKALLGRRAYEIPINSIKSMTGHTMGAAGTLEAIAAILSIRDGIIPPTINLENPDPECDLNYTPNRAVRKPIRTAISNSAGIGGCNAVVIFACAE